MGENVCRMVRAHGTHRADPTRPPDVNPFFADVAIENLHSKALRKRGEWANSNKA